MDKVNLLKKFDLVAEVSRQQAQKKFIDFGACEYEMLRFVRKPNEEHKKTSCGNQLNSEKNVQVCDARKEL